MEDHARQYMLLVSGDGLQKIVNGTSERDVRSNGKGSVFVKVKRSQELVDAARAGG